MNGLQAKMAETDRHQQTSGDGLGVLAAFSAYGIWGLFPLYFRLLDGVSPPLIVAHRVIWSVVLLLILLKMNGRLGEVRGAFRDRKTLIVMSLSAMLLSLNWLVFVWAIELGRVIDASLGYFLNPLVNVALGMLLLGERQNGWQWASIVLAIIAMGAQTVMVGELPLISVTVAVSFGIYGYLRKTVSVGSAPGLLVETILMFPLALAYLGYSLYSSGPGPHGDPFLMILLILTGPITAGTLLMFAFGARRLRLTSMGMLQYIAPSLHFIIAVWVFRESLSMVQLASFALIWVSLAIYSADSVRRHKRERGLIHV